MVSLRVLEQQRAEQERKDRLESARRLGAQLGVDSARRYVHQKKQQEAFVHTVVKEQWLLEKQRKEATLERIAFEGQMRQGEGMRNAKAYFNQSANRCLDEVSAWEAERQLESERHRVALERQRLDALQKEHEDFVLAERRQKVREAEQARTAKILQSKSLNDHLNSSKFTNRSFSQGKPPASSVSISIHSPSQSHAEPSADMVAKKVIEERKSLDEIKREKARNEQRKAAQRAMKVVRDMKMEEERKRLEEEQESLLRQSMVENAMRSTIRPVAATDFQEQESRKAQQAQKKAESDFEKVFLRGPWTVEAIQRFHECPEEATAQSVLMPANVSELQTSIVPVQLTAIPLRLIELPLTEPELPLSTPGAAEPLQHWRDEETTAAADGDERLAQFEKGTQPNATNLDESFEAPNCASSLPQPTPKSPSPPQQQVSLADEGATGESGPVAAADTSAAVLDSTTSLMSRQEQFMKDLEALQSRLANAIATPSATYRIQHPSTVHAAAAAKDLRVNSSDELTLTSEGDMSISSMSSGEELSTKVRCSADSSTTSGEVRASVDVHHRSQDKKSQLQRLTAEQLRNALRRMKRQEQARNLAATLNVADLSTE